MTQLAWLTGMPRSGTTWVSQFFAASPEVRVKFCPLFSYTFKEAMSAQNTAAEWRSFFCRVYRTQDEYMDQGHLRSKGLIPTFSEKERAPDTLLIKSNRFHDLTELLMERLPEIRFVAIVRNPVDAIASWLNNPHEFPKDADPMQEWRSGTCRKTGRGEFWGFDDWKSITRMHLRLSETYPDRFFLYRYEDIKRDPFSAARRMFDQLDLTYTHHVPDFIEQSRAFNDVRPHAVFKAKESTCNGETQFDERIVREIHDDLNGTELEQFIAA